MLCFKYKSFDNYSIYPFALGHKNTTGYLNVETDNSGNTNVHPTKTVIQR